MLCHYKIHNKLILTVFLLGCICRGQAAYAAGVMDRIDAVLGVLEKDGCDGDGPGEEVAQLLAARQEARSAKDWARSDEIRDRLSALGWDVRDTADGQELKRK